MHERGNPYSEYLEAKGMGDLRDDETYKGIDQMFDGGPSQLPFEESYEGYILLSFDEFLKDISDDEPFLYQMDPLHPHENYLPAQEFWDKYEGMDLELPPSADEDLSQKPQNQREMASYCRRYDWVFEPKEYEAGVVGN